MAEWLEDPSYPDNTLSWNIIRGKIEKCMATYLRLLVNINILVRYIEIQDNVWTNLILIASSIQAMAPSGRI